MSMSLIAALKTLETYVPDESFPSSLIDALDVAVEALQFQLSLDCELCSISKQIDSVQSTVSEELAVFLVQVRDFAKTLDFAQCTIDSQLTRIRSLSKEVN